MPYTRRQQETTGFRKVFFRCVTRPDLCEVPLMAETQTELETYWNIYHVQNKNAYYGIIMCVKKVRFLNFKSKVLKTILESESVRLTDLLSQAGVLFARFNVDAVSDLHALYDRMYAQTIPVAREIDIVVMCTYKCVRRVLQAVTSHIWLSNQNKTWNLTCILRGGVRSFYQLFCKYINRKCFLSSNRMK